MDRNGADLEASLVNKKGENRQRRVYARLRDEDEYGEYEGMTFSEKQYDVACVIPRAFCCAKQWIYLHPNEAEFRSNCCLGCTEVNRRVPYGELAGIL